MRAVLRVWNKAQPLDVPAGESREITFALEDAFPYLKEDKLPRFVWFASISSDTGFVPAFHDGGADHRFLGVRVRPLLVE